MKIVHNPCTEGYFLFRIYCNRNLALPGAGNGGIRSGKHLAKASAAGEQVEKKNEKRNRHTV
jgi:hypothetical protein